MRRQARQLLKRGFTMVELLVVITIIVLMLAVAVPVVRVVQGNRSVEAGYNAVAAALGHARQLALYYRQPAGVVFYRDPITGLQDLGYVMRANFIGQNASQIFRGYIPFAPTSSTGNSVLPDQYLDMVPGEAIQTLPTGLAVQMLMENGTQFTATVNGVSVTVPERYMRLGVVMFDEDAQLVNGTYAFPYQGTMDSVLWTATQNVVNPGSTGALTPSSVAFASVANGFTVIANASPPPASLTPYTSPAICLYDDETYLNQSDANNGDQFSDDNNNTVTFSTEFSPQYPSSMPLANQDSTHLKADKLAEQNWLDQNAEVFVIKPNDGSLLRNK